MSREKIEPQIRWIIRRDLPEVLEIERACFEIPWTEEDFLCCLTQANCICMVAEHDHEIVGFMIYELHKTKLQLINFVVAPAEQRRGIGHQMIRRLMGKLSQKRRKEIVLVVSESNLSAQMFFKEQGFRAVRVLRNHYDDATEDAYVMQYRLEADAGSLSLENRISEFYKETKT